MKTISWQTLTASGALRAFFTIAMVAFWTACADDSQNLKGPDADAASKVTKISAPAISCAGSNETSIDIKVVAGATGLPAGFSLQWMTLTAYTLGPDGLSGTADDNSWYASDDLRLCKASFSGNANLSRYNLLKEGDAVTIRIGELLLDEGASTNCGGVLSCGTQYVFRAFGHATSKLNRSDFSANLICQTEDCEGGDCSYTQGWYKTNGSGQCGVGNDPQNDGWPYFPESEFMTIGGAQYTQDQLCTILWTAAGTCATTDQYCKRRLVLLHQLITARLNIEKGATSTYIQSTIDAADAWLQSGGTLTFDASWITMLDSYNGGNLALGTKHCE